MNLFLAFVAVVVALVLLRIALHKTRKALFTGLRRFAICLVSALISVAALDLVLSSYPRLQQPFVDKCVLWPNGLPSMIEDPKFGYTGRPNFEEDYVLDPMRDGILIRMVDPSRIVDSGEEPFPLHARHDKDGFLNLEIPAKADIVVVGDSFAYESYVPEGKHWVSIIKNRQKKTVYNIAMPGWGPSQEYLAFVQFGLPKKPNPVLWAFFEGNDIEDVRDFDEFKKLQKEKGLAYIDYIIHKRPYVPPRRFPYGRPVVRLLLHFGKLCNPGPIPFNEDIKAFNPVFLSAGGRKKPHAFLSNSFCQMSMPYDILSDWPLWQRTETLLKQAIDLTHSNGGRFVLILFPSKDRVYFPLIEEQVDKDRFYRFVLPSLLEGRASSPDDLLRKIRRNKSNVSSLLEKICRQKSVTFINTTDVLAEATMRGEFPY
ncbi:MAG: hypothetical protein ABIH04_05925, partial [Planctomycetota bacterium]